MWFEVLPAIGIIFSAMTLGMASTFWVPNLILGRPSMRELMTGDQLLSYMRDRRLTGHPYKFQGLDAIPDEDEDKTKSSSQ